MVHLDGHGAAVASCILPHKVCHAAGLFAQGTSSGQCLDCCLPAQTQLARVHFKNEKRHGQELAQQHIQSMEGFQY